MLDIYHIFVCTKLLFLIAGWLCCYLLWFVICYWFGAVLGWLVCVGLISMFGLPAYWLLVGFVSRFLWI